MAYEKHVWQTGQVITADKLNNIQDGINEERERERVYKVNLTLQGDGTDGNPYRYETDKTWQEIADAFDAGQKCLINYTIEDAEGLFLENGQSIIHIVNMQTVLKNDIYLYGISFNSPIDNMEDHYNITWYSEMPLTALSKNDVCNTLKKSIGEKPSDIIIS